MKKIFITLGCLMIMLATVLLINPTYASAAEAIEESGVTMQGGTEYPYNFGVVDLDTGFDLTFKAHLESAGNNATLNLVFTNVDNSDYSFKLTIWQNNASDRDVSTNLFIKANGSENSYENTGWMSYLVGGSNYSYHVAYDKEQTLMIEKYNGSLSPIENGVAELESLLATAPSKRYFIGFTSNVAGLCYTVKTFNERAFKANTTLYSELLEQYSTIYDLSFYPQKLEYSRLDSTMQSYYLNELRNEINTLESANKYQTGYEQGKLDGYSQGFAEGSIQNPNDIIPDDSEDSQNDLEGLFVEYPIIAILFIVFVLAFVIKLLIK